MNLTELQPLIKAEVLALKPEWRKLLSLRLRELSGGYRKATAVLRDGPSVLVYGDVQSTAAAWADGIVLNLEREMADMVKQTGGKFTVKTMSDPKPFGKTQGGFRSINTAIPKGPVGVTASGMKQPKARTLAGPRKSPD